METVKRAAALLDRARPGWENEIDTNTLYLNDSLKCVLAQAYGDFTAGWVALRREARTHEMDLLKGCNPESPWVSHGGRYETHWLVEIHHRRAVSAVELVTKQLVNA